MCLLDVDFDRHFLLAVVPVTGPEHEDAAAAGVLGDRHVDGPVLAAHLDGRFAVAGQ